jgi:eukaryotic-like serine/threonine-protein kinase
MNDTPPKLTLAGEAAGGGQNALVGRTLAGRFLVRKTLARGGMGQLYEAEQLPLGRVCALKVLDAGPAAQQDPNFARRFFLEASIAAKLKHPNTVTVFDYGQTEDGIYYLAMELLEGRTLRQALASDGPFEETRAVRVARQIGRSVREAHALGIVHRDLKPANVMLVEQGEAGDFVKVLDFGLAKPTGPEGEDLTASGQFVGTPKYMAPEQIEGRPVGPTADIYALGVVLYEMAAGRPPFEGDSSIHVLMAHLTQTPRPLEGVSETYAAIVSRALAKAPGDRFASIDEFLEALAPLDPTAIMSGSVPAFNEQGVRVPSIAPSRASTSASSQGLSVPVGGVSLAERANDSASGPLPSLTSARHSMSRIVPRRRDVVVGLGVATFSGALVALYVGLRLGQSSVPREAEGAPTAEVVTSLSDGPPAPPGTEAEAAAIASGSGASEANGAAGDLVHIESSPPGAEVRAGGRDGVELCASTPCDVPRASVASAGGRVYLARRGFVSVQKDISRSERRLLVPLHTTQTGAAKPSSALPGYKPAPY